MPVKVKRPVGRPSLLQLMITDALTGVALDFIAWQDKNRRKATGKSQAWTVELRRFGDLTPKDIQGQLIGVDYINFALFGRLKGNPPPLSKILAWMKVRGIRGRDISGRFRTDTEGARAIAWQIARFGTKALKLSPAIQEAIYARNLKKAVTEYTPQIATETAQNLVKGFVESLDDVKNIQVTTS